jgi:hypothetical protein
MYINMKYGSKKFKAGGLHEKQEGYMRSRRAT